MSAPTLRPLSRGKCLQDLKPHYDTNIKNKNISSLCKSAPKILEAAKKADQSGNQEESYILFMRYLNIISFVQRTEEFKKHKKEMEPLMSKRSMTFAIECAEKLSKSLQERYEKQKSKEEKIQVDPMPKKEIELDEEMQPKVIQKVDEENKRESRDSISCIELFKILQQDDSKVLILDARPRNQFSESHIRFESCINVPEEIIEPGCSASKLAEKLPLETKLKWSRRLEVEFLVLMDWFSSSSSLKKDSPLHRLQVIILQWDPAVTYQSKPLILNGGFEEWLNHYPMFCTNSKPQLPIQAFDELLHIDDVKYPDLIDETPKFCRSNKPVPKDNSTVPKGSVKDQTASSSESKVLNGTVDSNPTVPLANGKLTSPILKEESVLTEDKGLSAPKISTPNIPNVDRSSKVAALQVYAELEERRLKGVQRANDLLRDREAAEGELKKLQVQQNRNELTGKEKETLNQNEVNLRLRIQELQKSHRAKEEEIEVLRQKLEEYKSREDGQTFILEQTKPLGIPGSQSGDISTISAISGKLSQDNLRINPSTPNASRPADLSVPLSGSNLKRSRSSPNIPQSIQEVEPEPELPHFDRNTKPVIQKPQTLDFINRHRNFHEVYGTVKPGITGLKNLGNSCYMNSVLQCISNITVLNNYFCSGKYKEDVNRSPNNPTRGEVAEEVAQVIRSLWLGQYRSISCHDFKNVVGKHMDQFRGSGQQDAHEFLTFLMDWLHNDLKVQKEDHSKELSYSRSSKKGCEVDAATGAINAWNDFKNRHESFMLMAFFVQQVSTVQCNSCRVKSMNFEEPTSNLTLLLPSAARCSLIDCLRLYTSKERISGYKCESCHGLHDAEKSVDICRLPPILIIHLKRFYSDGFYQKRQTFVDFPLEGLDLKNYTPVRQQPHMVYDLCAVSNHYGTLEGGHYTAYCKNGHRWYKFDDQDVSEISREDVKSSNAYILFYAAVK